MVKELTAALTTNPLHVQGASRSSRFKRVDED